MDLAAKATRLRELHRPLLLLPNAWDAESARRLAELGFEALATTSGGVAEAIGYADGEQTRPMPCSPPWERSPRRSTCPSPPTSRPATGWTARSSSPGCSRRGSSA